MGYCQDEKVDYNYGGLDIHLLDALAEKQSELIGKFNDTGKLSMGDIYRFFKRLSVQKGPTDVTRKNRTPLKEFGPLVVGL